MTTYYEFKRFEENAARLGLVIKRSKHASNPGEETVALYPDDEKWPCFSPDFEMWSGSIDSMVSFMVGLEKGLNYAEYVGWNRVKAEAKYKAEVEKQKVRHEKNRTMTILKDTKDPGEFKEVKIGGELPQKIKEKFG